MADEIFALSPIAARPVQPSEQDYDAIKEAFMETSRGRWFLGEYAKRNRNADTKMVLDAVARIEDTIAAQKKPARDPLLDEALASFRVALAEARDAASAAVDGLGIEQNLAPVRKGARVIREIAWRLREIGADGRICDLIDSQVAAIEDAAAKLNPSSLADTLVEAFDRIEGKIASFDASDATPAASAPMAGAPAPEEAEIEPVAETEVETTAQAEAEAQAPAVMKVAQPAEPDATIEAAAVAGDAPGETEARTETGIETVAEAADEPNEAFDANDEALLDMVALEMAAPDTDEAYEPKLEDLRTDEEAALQVHERQVQAPQVGEPPAAASWEIDVSFGSNAGNAAGERAVAAALPAATPLQPEAEPQVEPARTPTPSLPPSLGSSLIANGIVTRPRTSGPDPLAPIRRMSQNEKIAFFS